MTINPSGKQITGDLSQRGRFEMALTLKELDVKIERKIAEIEQAKERLKEDLKVVRQAVSIAAEFEEPEGESEWQQPDQGYPESQAV
jgi:hypothetical protein